MLTPAQLIGGFIGDHEGGLSLNPSDAGNWYDAKRFKTGLPFRRGVGALVGSNRGVTAYALAQYRILNGMSVDRAATVSRSDIASLTIAIAVNVGLRLFYFAPGFDKLVWNRVTMSIIDKAWGSGPGTAIMMLQKILGLHQDASLGPVTVAAYAAWIKAKGEDAAAKVWCTARQAKDFAIAHNEGPDDPDLKFLRGWDNRSESFLPGSPWWTAAA